MASSSFQPTKNRATVRERLGLAVEYRYSTPGISQSSFSRGLVTRCSTSLADAPGICTKTSIIGTVIWGSSSRGSRSTARTPSMMEAPTIRGVNGESMKNRRIVRIIPNRRTL